MKTKQVVKRIIHSNSFTANLYKEYRVQKYSKAVKLEDIVIYANSFCNAECSFCDVPRADKETGIASGIARPLLGTPLYMTTELFRKVMSDKLVTSGNPKFINFLMTEPLLSKNLPDMLQIAKNGGHITKVTTNGYLLSKRSKDIVQYLDYLQVSIDALQPLHDEIRGKGFFQRAIDGLKDVRKISNVHIEINITMAPVNYKDSYKLLEYIDGLGLKIDEVRFQFLDFVSETMSMNHTLKHPTIPQSSTGSDDDLSFSNIDFREMLDILRRIRSFKAENIAQIYLKPNLDSLDDIVEYFNLNGNPIAGRDVCATPFNQMAVATNGDIYWHMRCYNDYKLGNININSLHEVFYGQIAENFREEFEKSECCMPACTRCCGIIGADRVL